MRVTGRSSTRRGIEEERYGGYVINLARVCDLHESGLTWLRAFMGWAKVFGAWVCLINVKPKHACRCIESGIPVVQSPVCRCFGRSYRTELKHA